MMIYIALLRGVNVGGKNKIKMARLRHTLEAMGISRVQTYIQSGNILFESNGEEEPLQKQIEKIIEKEFGFVVSVVLRTATELEKIIWNCPFPEKDMYEAKTSAIGESLYVALMPESLSQKSIERLSRYKIEQETYQIEGREIYLLFHHSIRNSKLGSNLQKLGIPVTIRNWKTLNKLATIANAMNI